MITTDWAVRDKQYNCGAVLTVIKIYKYTIYVKVFVTINCGATRDGLKHSKSYSFDTCPLLMPDGRQFLRINFWLSINVDQNTTWLNFSTKRFWVSRRIDSSLLAFFFFLSLSFLYFYYHFLKKLMEKSHASVVKQNLGLKQPF